MVFSVASVSLWCICLLLHWGVRRREENSTGKIRRPRNRSGRHSTVKEPAMTWSVKDGRLYCGRDPVGVRRVVVELVVGRLEGPVAEEKARNMIRMERA